MRRNEKRVFIGLGTAITLIVLAVVLILLFVGGDIGAEIWEGRLRVNGVFGAGATVDLDGVTGMELRETFSAGRKVFGTDSFKVFSGTFSNQEFGRYQLHIYRSIQRYIVLHGEETVVFNLSSPEETEECYDALREILTLE
jgi:hypothetical protein